MFIEKNNSALRKPNVIHPRQDSDIEYLNKYFLINKRFPMFSQVLIETQTDCNRKCTFCPQYHQERSFKKMDWQVYKRIIDELVRIGFAGRVALFVTNEPLLETRLLKMIKYARNKSSRLFLDITTNGKLLSINKLDSLLKAGIDNININDYRSDREKNPDGFSKNITELHHIFKSNPKITFNRRSTKETLSNYAGVIRQTSKLPINEFCNYPFRKIVFSPNGNLVLCCNDYMYSTNFGSIIENNIDKLWDSEELNQYRINLLRKERRGLCESCNEVQDYEVF